MHRRSGRAALIALAAATAGYELLTVEATALCRRGGSVDGLCV